MTVLQNVISSVFLYFSITALPIGKDSDDNGDLFQPDSYQLSRNKNGTSVSTWTKSSFMNSEENVIRGDNQEPMNLARTGIADKTKYWPNGIVPYEIRGPYNYKEKNMIKQAMNTIQFWTCIRFVPHKGENDFILIVHYKHHGCYTTTGRQGGIQSLFLESEECFDHVGTVIHELLHVLGVIHEHSRPDRDKYITVYDYNIPYGHDKDFGIYPNETIDFGVSYDFNSIMHYAENTGYLSGLKTFTPNQDNGNYKIGQRDGLSVRDVIKIMNMYNCYYEINDKENSSSVLPNPKEIKGSKGELWSTFFRNLTYNSE